MSQPQPQLQSQANGILKVKDGISRCESQYDLYEYVRCPDMARPLNPIKPKPEPLSARLKREALSKIQRGVWSRHNPFLLLLGFIVRYTFLGLVFPVILVGYLIPKGLILITTALILSLLKGLSAIASKLRLWGKILLKVVRACEQAVKRQYNRLFVFKGVDLIGWLKKPSMRIQNRIARMLQTKKAQAQQANLSIARALDRSVDVPRRIGLKIAKGIERMRELRLELRVWLLKAPFRFLAWLQIKIDQIETFKEKHSHKIRVIFDKMGAALDQAILGTMRFFNAMTHFILKGLRAREISAFMTSCRVFVERAVDHFGRRCSKWIFNRWNRFVRPPVSYVREWLQKRMTWVNQLIHPSIQKLMKRFRAISGKTDQVLGKVHVQFDLKVKKCTVLMEKPLSIGHTVVQFCSTRAKGSAEKVSAQFIGMTARIYTQKTSGMQRLGKRMAYGVCLSWAWGTAVVEYGLEQVQRLAVDMDRKFPVGAVLSRFQ